MTAPQEQSEPAYMDVMPLEGEGPAAADNAPGAAFSPDASAKYDAVMEFCLRRGQVLFTTLMTEFVSIHLGDLERFLQKMVQEGLLEPTESKDAYRGVQKLTARTPSTACDDDDDGDIQVITQSGGEAPLPRSDPPHAVMESTRGADCSVMGPDGSEYQTALQQQQQHVTDQLGNLSVHHEGQQQQHSRIDDFTWSKILQTGRKATTSVLKEVTRDSDHYPLLADIPLDNISFVPPVPELPQPDRAARIKWPATQKQLHNYRLQTEMRVGQAAREAATELRKPIRMADDTIGSQSPTEQLRLNKKDELSAAGLTKEMVLDHANKVSEMLKDVYDNVAHDVFDWTQPGPARPTRYRNRQERRRWKDLHKIPSCA
ncbi:TPA: hypothetical protein ACH3X1_015762 [Trebouxia sp. C0004]